MATTELSVQQLQQQLEQRSRQLEAAFRITSALYSVADLDQMLQQTLNTSLDVVGASAGTIFLYDPERDELVFRYVVGEKAAELTGKGIKPTQGIAGAVFQSGEAQITVDAASDKRHLREIGEQIKYVTRNMVTVPLKSIEGKPIGVMQVLNKKDGMFDEHDMELLSIMAVLAATAIENARLQEAARLAIVTKMLGDISHDIKNMLTPVVTSAQTLEVIFQSSIEELERTKATSQGNEQKVWEVVERTIEPIRSFFPEALEMIMDGSTSIQERVREIADCVKGIIAEPHFEVADVNRIASTVLKALKPVADREGVELRLETEPDTPEIPIDQKRIYNAIYNLVNNAIPETPAGGSVTVRTHAVQDGKPFPEGSYFMIEVSDTGKGMPPEVKARLFSDKAISTKAGGTGLGTRIVKNVVDAHGGVITFESEEGKGTTFYIKLPLTRQQVSDTR